MTPLEIQVAIRSFADANQSFEVRSTDPGMRCIFNHVGDVWHMMLVDETRVAKSLCGTAIMVDHDGLDDSMTRIAVTDAGLLCGWLSVRPETVAEIIPAEVARWSRPSIWWTSAGV